MNSPSLTWESALEQISDLSDVLDINDATKQQKLQETATSDNITGDGGEKELQEADAQEVVNVTEQPIAASAADRLPCMKDVSEPTRALKSSEMSDKSDESSLQTLSRFVDELNASSSQPSDQAKHNVEKVEKPGSGIRKLEQMLDKVSHGHIVSKSTNVNTLSVVSPDNNQLNQTVSEILNTANLQKTSNDLVEKNSFAHSSPERSNSGGAITVSVADDGQETLHCIGQNQEQMFSFLIENNPDESTVNQPEVSKNQTSKNFSIHSDNVHSNNNNLDTPAFLRCLTADSNKTVENTNIISESNATDGSNALQSLVAHSDSNKTGCDPLNLSVHSSPNSSLNDDPSAKERSNSSLSLSSPKSVTSIDSGATSLGVTSAVTSSTVATASTASTSRINKRKRKDPVRSLQYSIFAQKDNIVTEDVQREPLRVSAPVSINPKPLQQTVVKEEESNKVVEVNKSLPHASEKLTQLFNNVVQTPSDLPRSSNNVHSLQTPFSSDTFNVSQGSLTLSQQQQLAAGIQPRPRSRSKQMSVQPTSLPVPLPPPPSYMNNTMFNPSVDHNMGPPMRPLNFHHIRPINIAPENNPPPPGFSTLPRFFPPNNTSGRMPSSHISPYSMPHNNFPPNPYHYNNAAHMRSVRPSPPRNYFFDPYPSYPQPPPHRPPGERGSSVLIHHLPQPHQQPVIISPDNNIAPPPQQPPRQPPPNPFTSPPIMGRLPQPSTIAHIPLQNQQLNTHQQQKQAQSFHSFQIKKGAMGTLNNNSAVATTKNLNAPKAKSTNSNIVPSKISASNTNIRNTIQSVTKLSKKNFAVGNIKDVAQQIVQSVLPKAGMSKQNLSSKNSGKSSASTSKFACGNSEQDKDRISSEILKEQPIPTYKPSQPPAALKFKTPLKTYKCQGCGDEFLFSTSLVNHLERKTMLINYRCEECKKVIPFYNRCCLFVHAKSHAKGAKAYRLNINLANIKVLPEELMPEILKENNSSTTETSLTNNKKEKECSAAAQSSKATSSAASTVSSLSTPAVSPLPTLNYNPNFFTTVNAHKKRLYKCVECKKTYNTLGMYKNHFTGKMSKTPCMFKCSKCFTDVVGICASSAHMRVHSKESPYVCPDCGEFISGKRDVFLKHLKQKCLHFQKTLLMRCTVCNSVVLFDPETVAKHYMEMHYSKYFKCLECPMAFKTSDSFGNHNKSTHKGKAEHKLICKCALCDTVFHKMDNVQNHFKSAHWPDMSKHSCFTAYKCTQCSPQKLFNNKNAYSYHMKQIHSVFILEEMCNECGEEFKTESQMKAHRTAVHGDFDVPVEEDEQAAAQKSQVDISKTALENSNRDLCSIKDENLKEVEVTAVNEAKDLEDKLECLKCSTTFASPDDYKKHMAKHKFVEKRKLMGEKVPSIKIKKLKVENLNRKTTFKVVPENDESHEKVIQKSSKSPAQTESVSASLMNNLKRSSSATKFVSQVPTAPLPKPRHKCSECLSTFFSTDELQEHLKMTHGESPQFPCHLCGNTYESRDVTERHIQLVHEGKSKDHAYMCWVCRDSHNSIKGFSSWKGLEKHLTGHHKLHKNNIDYSRFPKFTSSGDADGDSLSSKKSEGVDLEDNPIKRLRLADDKIFSCAKCKYNSDERAEFLKHITKHRLDDSEIQCVECGLCFAVSLSLKRHLFMVHKIRDFKKYQEDVGINLESNNSKILKNTKQKSYPSPLKTHVSQIPNGISQPNLDRLEKKTEERKKSTEVEEGNPYECNVCYKTFDSDMKLRKHIRMHGMAFIRSRRTLLTAWD